MPSFSESVNEITRLVNSYLTGPLENKIRLEKMNEEFSQILDRKMNKVMNAKIKAELMDRFNNMTVFYENYTRTLNSDNINTKSNFDLYLKDHHRNMKYI